MNYSFIVKNEIIRERPNLKLYTGNAGAYTFEFEFDEHWAGLQIFVTFSDASDTYVVKAENNKVRVPQELLINSGICRFGVYGTNGSDDILRMSSNIISFEVLQGAYCEGNTPTAPTPDLWEALIAKTVPIIGDNGNWWIWSMEEQGYIDSGVYAVSEKYNDNEIRQAIEAVKSQKADKAQTLEGYGIENAYTKNEIDEKLSDSISSLNEIDKELSDNIDYLDNKKADDDKVDNLYSLLEQKADTKEDKSNKIIDLLNAENITDNKYPTAKAVTEYVENSEKETAALLKKKSIPYTTVTGCTISISDHLEGESVIDCKIYGNSVQNGTPSPDNPVEIQSVGDLVTDEASEYYGKYDIPIVVNDTITHIYLDEPLRKVGDYADYIDYGNQKVVRKIKELKLESNLKYRLWIYNDILYGFALYLYDTVSECMVLSNYFKPVTDNLMPNKYDNSIYVKFLELYIGTSDWTTTDDFKAWLSDKDVTILYPLITPTEEPISLPVLTTPKASVANVSIHTTIQPSNIALTYYQGINKVVDGIGGLWGLDLPLIKTITLQESVTSVDILSSAEGIKLQEFTVLLFIKALGDVVESNLNSCMIYLRTNGGGNYFGYKGGYCFSKENNSFAFWHTKIYNKQFALTNLYSGYGNGSSDIPYMGFQGITGATPTQYSSYTSFLNEQLVDSLNILIRSSDVSRGAIIPQGSMIFLLGR